MRISVINDDAATEVISPLGYILVFPFHCVFFLSLILIMSRFLFFFTITKTLSGIAGEGMQRQRHYSSCRAFNH